MTTPDDKKLRADLIRLAHNKPEFRSEILDVLKEASQENSEVATGGYILVIEKGKAIASEGPFRDSALKSQIGRAKKKHPKGDTFLKVYKGTPQDHYLLEDVSDLKKHIPFQRKKASQNKESRVFRTPEALEKYLKKHPKSDKSKHSVAPSKKKEPKPPKKESKPSEKKAPADVSKQKGFESLKGLSPEKQRQVIERALEMGKPKSQRKPVRKDVSKQKGFESLKGLSPEKQKKVIERALKMAAENGEKEAKFEKGKSVDVGKWLRENGHADVADKWEEHEGQIGKKSAQSFGVKKASLAAKVKHLKIQIRDLAESLVDYAEQAEEQGYPRGVVRRLDAAHKHLVSSFKEVIMARRGLG